MNNNPLFPSNDQPSDDGYIVSEHQLRSQSANHSANPAADLIREKLARVYEEEPDAQQEAREAEQSLPHSKHQAFMHTLSTSGKSLADIHTAWHNYYLSLPDEEKHQVWQEFYAASGNLNQQRATPTQHLPYKSGLHPAIVRHAQPRSTNLPELPTPVAPQGTFVSHPHSAAPAKQQTLGQIRDIIRHKVTAGGRLKAKHHIQSLLFGLSAGAIVLVLFLFSFFNEVIIAPFIQPARTAHATPIIVDPSTVTATSTPEIIIPKINLEIPADFSQTSTNEADIENALENGIVHYPSTVLPGQQGNAAFFGHSSNNIFNPGKYKFAFVLLHELVPGDIFYITYNSKVYIYKVSSTRIVEPTEVSVLNNIAGKLATATLITCDPPGTSLHRLVVVGDQISPDPITNSAGSNTTAPNPTSVQLPGNGPTLPERLWHWLTRS